MKRYHQTPIMHRVVEHNGVLHFGGIIADDLSQNMSGQTAQICRKLDQMLIQAGSSKNKIVSATIFITDMSAKEGMNEAWTAWLEPDHLPARATIGVSDLGKNVLIEIVASAASNESAGVEY